MAGYTPASPLIDEEAVTMKKEVYLLVVPCRDCESYVWLPRNAVCCNIDYLGELEQSANKQSEAWKVFTRAFESERKRHESRQRKTTASTDIVNVKKKQKRKKNHYNMSKHVKEFILKRDKRRCTKCRSKKRLHIHHIIYRENGGTDDPDNLVTLCELCHAEEHRGEPVYNIMIKSLFEYQTVNA